jgi:calcineurin-like phosphoesterase
LPGGSAFITDLGMCGPENSSLGVRTEIAIKKIKTAMPVRFELSRNPVKLEGAIFTLEGTRIKALSQIRI